MERRIITMLAAASALCVAACSGPGEGTGMDASTSLDGEVLSCPAHPCDDDLFCNGVERCDPADPGADARGCVAGAPACEEACDEVADECRPGECDADGDAHTSIACGGDDCDDGDASRFPGNPEVCDLENVDEDCDPRSFGFRDQDSDGDPDAQCCNGEACGTDCEDLRPTVSSTATEVCDGLDNDCDGDIDDGALRTFYVDGDGDGYGASDPAAETRTACMPPEGFVESATDCADGDAAVNPGNAEQCDMSGRDENCSGVVDEDCGCLAPVSRSCADAGASGRCAAGNQACDAATGRYGACSILPVAESCNGEDDDCNDLVDDGVTVTCFVDADGDTYAGAGAAPSARCPEATRPAVGGCPAGFTNRAPIGAVSQDCDEASVSRNPGADESCNGVDDDCDVAIDEGLRVTCYRDVDGDTYALAGAAATLLCPDGSRVTVGGCPIGYTNRPSSTAADCNDAAAGGGAIYPGAAEQCNATDMNCDGDPYDGMVCRLGQTRDCGPRCTIFGGYGGSQSCVAAGSVCGWGTCVSHSDNDCDARDENCNGLVDESATPATCRAPLYRRHVGSSAIRSTDTLISGSTSEGGSAWSGPGTAPGGRMFVYSGSTGMANTALIRCRRSSNGLHFFTALAACPSGWVVEGTMGYVVAPTWAMLYLSGLVAPSHDLALVWVLTDGISWFFTTDYTEYEAALGARTGRELFPGTYTLWREPSAAQQSEWGIRCDSWPRAQDGATRDGCVMAAAWRTQP